MSALVHLSTFETACLNMQGSRNSSEFIHTT